MMPHIETCTANLVLLLHTPECMGIKHLNKHIVENCKQCIRFTSFNELRGKTIAVDISIYLYKFQMTHSVIENLYIMLSLFEQFDIHAIFVFDGKPPPEKKEILEKRYRDKMKAEGQYYDLHARLVCEPVSEEERGRIEKTMETLKRKFIYIKKEELNMVERLIVSYGYPCLHSAGEADNLCHMLVKYGHAWACMSEDMDMFVYGVPRVLRCISLVQSSCVLYDTQSIRRELYVSHETFMDICIMCGTDYNTTFPCSSISKLFNLVMNYQAYSLGAGPGHLGFVQWINQKGEYYPGDIDKYMAPIRKLFMEENGANMEIIRAYKKVACRDAKNARDVQNIMEQNDFVYPPTTYCVR